MWVKGITASLNRLAALYLHNTVGLTVAKMPNKFTEQRQFKITPCTATIETQSRPAESDSRRVLTTA